MRRSKKLEEILTDFTCGFSKEAKENKVKGKVRKEIYGLQ